MTESSKNETSEQQDANELLARAMTHPGIEAVMAVQRATNAIMRQVNSYLPQPRVVVSSSNGSIMVG